MSEVGAETGLPAAITAQQVAQLSTGGASAVSNWIKRKTDFPIRDDEGLFDRDEIFAWLKANGRLASDVDGSSRNREVWRALEELRRSGLSDSASFELVLQLLTLRSASLANPSHRLAPMSDVWARVLDSENPRVTLVAEVLAAARGDDELIRALLPQGGRPFASNLSEVVRILDSIKDLQECRHVAQSAFERWMTTTGHRTGEFASSPALVEMAVELLRPIEGRILDPATGAASMLRRSAEVAAKPVQLFGQERNESSWRIGMLFLLLSGHDFELRVGDSLQFDAFPELKAGRVFVDPPYGMRTDIDVAAGSEQRWTFGARRGSASEILWIQHCIHHLADDGVGVVLVAPNFLFHSRDREFREWLTRSGHLNAVIGLPGRIAYATGIPLVMLLLSGQPTRSDGQVLFVDASEMQTGSGRTGPVLDSTDVQRVRDAVDRWESGAPVDESAYSRSVPVDEIASQDYDLSPKRFISILKAAPTIDGEQLPERLERLKPITVSQLAFARDSATRLAMVVSDFTPGNVTTHEVRLGDLLTENPVLGRAQTDSDQSTPMPWIPTAAIGDALLEPPDATTGEDLGERAAQRGDVLLGEIPSGAGRFSSSVVEFDGPSGFSRSILRLRPNPAVVDARYLSNFLSSRVGAAALMSITGGATIQRVRKAALIDLRIELPTLEQQRRLADALDRLQSERTALEHATQTLADLTETIAEGLTVGSINFESSHAIGMPR